MVLSQRRTSMHHARQQTTHIEPDAKLDANRIVGMAIAMTINIAALMLLLVPVSAPTSEIQIKDDPTIFQWRDPIKPPPLPPPPVVPITPPQAMTPPIRQTAVTPPQQTQTTTETIVPDGTEYTPPTQFTETVSQETSLPVSTDPQPATRLEYASAPAPAYPRDAILDGLQGTVYLKVLVDVDGTPLSVEIQRSSGHRKLDDAARRQVLKKWKFRPAMQNGQAIQVYGIVPVDFSLSRQ
jgi:periplasmic protein TonB